MTYCHPGASKGTNGLLGYLQQRGWRPVLDQGREEVAGLCPLHDETRPSFYVNRRKQVFYCHGCGRGGGLAQLRQLFGDAPPPTISAPSSAGELLAATYAFYEQQLPRHEQAYAYLAVRGIHDVAVIRTLRIGYAPGACLRRHLTDLGFAEGALVQSGLLDRFGRDAFFRCLTFPLARAANLYGRSIHQGMADRSWRHRFLPRSKGGLYGWERAHLYSAVILVEGLLDLASLWQAGFGNAVASLGSHLNSVQLAELYVATDKKLYLCMDADQNRSGEHAATSLQRRLRKAGIDALRMDLPDHHDPNSFFAAGASRADFQRLMDRARP